MSYIGNQPPDIGAYDVESFDGGGTEFTLKKSATTPSVLLFIDGVRQTPTDAYSVSGVTLTTTATTPSGTDNVTVMFMGDVVDIGAPSDDTISTAKIQDDAVTAAKLANSINTEIAANTAKVTNATHTGDVTGATALTIATDAVDIAMLSATGTADATTFLRGDNSWVAAGGSDNTPAFHVKRTSNFDIGDDTVTLVEFDIESWDTDSAYDTSAFRFTVPADEAGKYFMYVTANISGTSLSETNLRMRVNGTNINSYQFQSNLSLVTYNNTIVTVLDLSVSDYVDVTAQAQVSGGVGSIYSGGIGEYCYFGGYKLGF